MMRMMIDEECIKAHTHHTHQRWSPRGRGLGLEDPRGQLMVSLALALKL